MARSSRTTDRDLGWKRILRETRKAAVAEVVIGVQAGDVNDDSQLIAEYAAYNEFGTEKIPERSFMRTAFDENLPAIKKDMDNRYAQMLAGQVTARQALGLIGLRNQDFIKTKIDTNIPPPNAPATIEQKGSSHTLIDTGAMKNSIHYIVRGKT